MIRDEILKEIAFECAEGLFEPLTYHTCVYCGEHPARGERCADCWRKILDVMDHRELDDDTDEVDPVDGC